MEGVPCNNTITDIIGPLKISRKTKEPLILNSFTMIDLVIRWFEVAQYNNNRDDPFELSRNCVDNQISLTNINHV